MITLHINHFFSIILFNFVFSHRRLLHFPSCTWLPRFFGGTGHYTVDVLYAVLSLEQILLVNLG